MSEQKFETIQPVLKTNQLNIRISGGAHVNIPNFECLKGDVIYFTDYDGVRVTALFDKIIASDTNNSGLLIDLPNSDHYPFIGRCHLDNPLIDHLTVSDNISFFMEQLYVNNGSESIDINDILAHWKISGNQPCKNLSSANAAKVNYLISQLASPLITVVYPGIEQLSWDAQQTIMNHIIESARDKKKSFLIAIKDVSLLKSYPSRQVDLLQGLSVTNDLTE